MGVVPSCYPSKSQRRVNAVTQPFDTRRLLSELITVQTAIVLNEDATSDPAVLPPGVVATEDELGKVAPDSVQVTPQPTPQRCGSSRRCSVEYTITSKTSLGFPGNPNNTTTMTTTTSKADVVTLNALTNSATDLADAHVTAHNREISDEGKKMPSIQELRETSGW
nr:uncharacterized protein LOC129270080 [Lytechinus pictus]